VIRLVVSDSLVQRAGAFMRKHRFDFDTSEAMDALAAEFEAVRAEALKDAAEWCENVGRKFDRRSLATVAFHCVNVIRARAGDPP
jgi:hypothetical protein